jgi:dienelactone hydrolase
MRAEYQFANFLLVSVVFAAVGCTGSSDTPGDGVTGGTGGAPPHGSAGAATGGTSGPGEGAGGTGAGANGGSTGQSAGTGNSGPGATGGSISGSGGAGGSTSLGGTGGAVTGAAGRLSGGSGGETSAGGTRASGGRANAAGGAAGMAAGGRSMTATGGSGAAAGSGNTGTCTASKPANSNVSGSGPHKVTVETNSDSGISEGTIFRPTDLGGTEKYPIFVWGEGGCSENGLSNSAAMAELASHGYFVIADGTPNGSASRTQGSDVVAMAKPLLAYIDWAVAENGKSCSAYYQSLDTTKIASNGFSCGGLMAEGTAGDARITTWGLNSSGMFSANQAFYKTVHTPVLIVLGGSGDIAYTNGERDYDNISAAGIPIMLFSKALGHGGDLFSKNGGDFTKIDLAWLNWWLKGDETATGKGLLVGASCPYCSDSAWETKSANLP